MESEARKSLAQHARSCDAFYKEGGGVRATPHHRVVLQSMHLVYDRGVQSILDVGCGRGILAVELAIQGYEVTCTEICPSLITGDLKRLAAYPYAVGALGAFDPKSFDLVLGCDLLEDLRDMEEVDEFLGHAERLARIGVMVTTGGPSGMHNINEPSEFWRGKLGAAFGEHLQERNDKKSGVFRWLFWLGRDG
jgi:2-polyprenyl-3-methyl-5-hydroxy-6-metoxy-1,4-benzoquinol methylase